MHTLRENVKAFTSIVPAAYTAATQTGSSFDARDFKTIGALVPVGAIASGLTLDLKLQGSHDDSAWVDIPGAAITQLADTDDNTLSPMLEYRRVAGDTYRYVRAVGTVAGGAGTADYGVVLLGGLPVTTPVS